MEQNFLKVVEPYDVVELSFVAEKMELPLDEVYIGKKRSELDHSQTVSDDSG